MRSSYRRYILLLFSLGICYVIPANSQYSGGDYDYADDNTQTSSDPGVVQQTNINVGGQDYDYGGTQQVPSVIGTGYYDPYAAVVPYYGGIGYGGYYGGGYYGGGGYWRHHRRYGGWGGRGYGGGWGNYGRRAGHAFYRGGQSGRGSYRGSSGGHGGRRRNG